MIFDEIQECPRALTALKYFCEENPEYAICAAGSLLGIAVAAKTGFPVGKVDMMELRPCSFREFLRAAAPLLLDYLAGVPLEPLPGAMTVKLEGLLREYLAIGGMPAVVSAYLDTRDIWTAEEILESILQSYASDFSKHIPARDIPKLHLIWQSIPRQFARENRRFLYGEVRAGARSLVPIALRDSRSAPHM